MYDPKKEHPSGLSPSSNGNSKEDVEGTLKPFRHFDHPLDETSKEPGEPNEINEATRPEGWTTADDPTLLPEERGLGAGPEIKHPDPEALEATRVPDDHEIIGHYNPATDKEEPVIRQK